MTDRPYMEISAGLDNILRVFRVDYVWRLTCRDNPMSRWGHACGFSPGFLTVSAIEPQSVGK